MNQEKGFSLIETLIAMLLITMMMLIIPSLPGLARFSQEYSVSSAVAENIAENILELYRNKQFNDITDSAHDPTPPAPVTINTNGVDHTYTPTITVTGYAVSNDFSNPNIYNGSILTGAKTANDGAAFHASDVKVVTVNLHFHVGNRQVEVTRFGVFCQ